MNFQIIEARPTDAPFLGHAIMTAIGREVCADIAGGEDKLEPLEQMFARLAAREDTQYSYRNALVAISSDGSQAGAIIAYDGALLHELRERFVEEHNRTFGSTFSEADMDDETSPDEIYIDTLMVEPQYRRMGIAQNLIKAVTEKHKDSGKPVGLLVDYTNPRARALYTKYGFISLGDRPFCGTVMEHMQNL